MGQNPGNHQQDLTIHEFTTVKQINSSGWANVNCTSYFDRHKTWAAMTTEDVVVGCFFP